MQKLETETKLELNRDGFQVILEGGVLRKKVDQLNIYFDSHWKLANRKSTFRIRLSHNKSPQITFKIPVSINKDRRVAKEFEFDLNAESSGHSHDIRILAKTLLVKRLLPSDMAAEMKALGIQKLERVGWVRNSRYVVAFYGYGEIELDHLKLPDGSDFFEVEIEESDPLLRNKLVTLIRELVPDARPSLLSKFERFRQAVIERQGGKGLFTQDSRSPKGTFTQYRSTVPGTVGHTPSPSGK